MERLLSEGDILREIVLHPSVEDTPMAYVNINVMNGLITVSMIEVKERTIFPLSGAVRYEVDIYYHDFRQGADITLLKSETVEVWEDEIWFVVYV